MANPGNTPDRPGNPSQDQGGRADQSDEQKRQSGMEERPLGTGTPNDDQGQKRDKGDSNASDGMDSGQGTTRPSK